jgi:hypothetical protein
METPFRLPSGEPPPRKATNTALIITIVAIVVLTPVLVCGGAALLAGAFLSSRAMTTRVEQTATNQFQFAVSDHPTIAISDTAGQVTIGSGDVQQVTVEATKRAGAASRQEADDLLSTMSATAEATASGVSINGTIQPNHPGSRRTIDLRITVPQTSDIHVTLSAGTISVDSITGVLDVTNTAGTVTMADMTVQGASNVRVTTGMLRFDGALASKATMTATVTTGNANIRLPQTSATHFDASTHVGSVSISSWAATIHQSSAGQSSAFDLNPQPTSTMTVRVDVGAITLGAR